MVGDFGLEKRLIVGVHISICLLCKSFSEALCGIDQCLNLLALLRCDLYFQTLFHILNLLVLSQLALPLQVETNPFNVSVNESEQGLSVETRLIIRRLFLLQVISPELVYGRTSKRLSPVVRLVTI